MREMITEMKSRRPPVALATAAFSSCSPMNLRAEANTISRHISTKTDRIFPMLSRDIMFSSEPTTKWKADAKARPLTLGAAQITRAIHSSEMRFRDLDAVCFLSSSWRAARRLWSLTKDWR